MVRLKDNSLDDGQQSSDISIPYGSIKSPTNIKDAESLTEFQFLMVRLKEKREISFNIFCCISIPYGSIKSPISLMGSAEPTSFQFLMVRLKEFADDIDINDPRDFNSLWFD